MDRYHVIQGNGPCLTCGRWCEQCNQCKCEIGLKRICPGFDTKRNPVQFEHWKLDTEIGRLEESIQYVPYWKREAHASMQKRLTELLKQKERLANGG